MTFATGPLPQPTPPKGSEPHPLASMLAEARAMLADRAKVPSNASTAILRLVVRLIETQMFGAPKTAIPSSIDHPEDSEPPPPPMPSRRL
jgi:hypothetical protein